MRQAALWKNTIAVKGEPAWGNYSLQGRGKDKKQETARGDPIHTRHQRLGESAEIKKNGKASTCGKAVKFGKKTKENPGDFRMSMKRIPEES